MGALRSLLCELTTKSQTFVYMYHISDILQRFFSDLFDRLCNAYGLWLPWSSEVGRHAHDFSISACSFLLLSLTLIFSALIHSIYPGRSPRKTREERFVWGVCPVLRHPSITK